MCLLWFAVSSSGLDQVWSHKECSWEEVRALGTLETGRIEEKVANGYIIDDGLGRSVVGAGFGRVFLDEAIDWVVKRGQIVLIFERTGGAHFFQEVKL